MKTLTDGFPSLDMRISRGRAVYPMLALTALLCAGSAPAQSTTWSIVGWNNLGMHCMDSDYSVFSILPPYNTINAQIIKGYNGEARLIGNASTWSITYRAVSDPDGSKNTTSIGKGNFWDFVAPLYGVALAPDQGLPVPGPSSYSMPGISNTPQRMGFEAAARWYVAYGIPITPYDNKGNQNPYPMMRLKAHKKGILKAKKDIVLPISDEMNCYACHGSGSDPAAQPAAGWVFDANPDRDQRLNILSLHDEMEGSDPVFRAALSTCGYSTNGLLDNVVTFHEPILCAACHHSEALPNSGLPNIPPLTEALHSLHATVVDPGTGINMNDSSNRFTCYRCHPGAVTRCLRGVMSNAVLTNGIPAIQCQSCHGSMSKVGSNNRAGWLDEPNCQACHTGTATDNAGAIRYQSALVAPGVLRTAGVTATFASNPNTPDAGHSLFRYSRGHGGLYCSACHGSTHAEFPTFNRNDNLYSVSQQGYVGTVAECTTCHGGKQPSTVNGGPHGLHPLGQRWVNDHPDHAGSDCRACHGVNGEGTVLSRARTVRTLRAFNGGLVRTTWRGYTISCYTCHRGPDDDSKTSNQPPVVTDRVASTSIGAPLSLTLSAADADGPHSPVLRVVTQPFNGTVGLIGAKATYYPMDSFTGTDTFTYAAADGELDSNLGTVTVTVVP